MKYFLLIFSLGLIGCKSGSYLTGTSKITYNLKGSVKLISEKEILSTCDSNGVILSDSASFSNLSFTNTFFDKKGVVLKWEIFDKDSLLTSKQDYIYSKSGKLKRIDIYRNGKLKEFTKILNHTDTILETETFDNETRNLIVDYKINFVNGLIDKRTINNIKDSTVEVTIFKRDSSGNEIEIMQSRKKKNQATDNIIKVKYLSFDDNGNWIKRSIFWLEDNGDCNVTLRRINYY